MKRAFDLSAYALAVLTMLPTVRVGAEEPAAEKPLETIEVTGEPASEAEQRAPTAFVSVINPAEHTTKMETTADALGESVGTQVRRFGGLGAFSLLSIRGSNPNQVRIFLDGIPLSRASDETVDVSTLPLDSLQSIEVYRGVLPVAFGVQGTGGVVNLVTKPPQAEPSTEASASYGSFETRKVDVAHTQQFGDVGFLGYATYLGSKGNFTFRDDNETPMQPNDDKETTRKNNAFNSLDALLRGTYPLPGEWKLDLTSNTFYKDQGIPGVGNDQSLDSSLNTLRAVNFLRATNRQLLGGDLTLAPTFFSIYQRQTFEDPNGELFGVDQETQNNTTAFGGTLTGTYDLLPSNTVGWFFTLSGERFVQTNLLQNQTFPPQTRLDLPIAIEDRAAFLDDRLLIVPTLGYEHLADSFNMVNVANQPVGPRFTESHDFFNPALGMQLNPFPWLVLKGNIGQFHRAPNFSELFGNLGIVFGNPNLKPETVVNRDIGFAVSWRPESWLDRLTLEYAYFYNDSNDLITPVQVSAERFTFENIGSARTSGNEVSLGAGWLGHFRLDVNYTNQNAVNLSPNYHGNDIPFLPANEVYARLSAYHPIGQVYYELNYVSSNFTDLINFDAQPARTIQSVGFTCEYFAPVTVSFSAQNITNNQISDLAGFPLPGLSFFGTVGGRF